MTAEQVRPLLCTARRGRPDPRTPGGSAPFASRPAAERDRALAASLPALARVWRGAGLPVAATALRHYAAATGRALSLDPVGPLCTAPFRLALDRHLQEWRHLALDRFEATGGRQDDFDTTTNWHGVRVRRTDDLDWWLALRGLQYRARGRMRLRPGVWPGRPAVHAAYQVEIYKDWNFDRGDGGLGTFFAALAQLHEVGLAREFPVVGASRELHWHA